MFAGPDNEPPDTGAPLPVLTGASNPWRDAPPAVLVWSS
jgi:hypothetical protein